jgi:hypothetical protein
MQLSWSNASGPRGDGGGFKILSYICGYCDNWVATGVGYHVTKVGVPSGADYGGQISICSHCDEPIYLSADGRQVPGPAFGATVAHLPSEDVAALYDEARTA